MDLGLNGKKASVTGGRRGIGRCIAEHLAAEGVSLATCARRADGLQAATEALKVKGVTVFSHRLLSRCQSNPKHRSSFAPSQYKRIPGKRCAIIRRVCKKTAARLFM